MSDYPTYYPGDTTQETIKNLLDALEKLYESFQHKDGNTKGNQAKTDIIKYNEDVREALNTAMWAIIKAKGG